MNNSLIARNLLRLLTVVVLSIILTAACSGAAGAPPTRIPMAEITDDGETIMNDSPRTETNAALPPTWTPEPVVEPATPVAPVPEAPAEVTEETYVVQPGDTLAELAELFGVGLDDLALANDIVDIDLIEVGQVLVIPK